MLRTLAFPKMILGNQVKVLYNKEATLQNLKLFFLSKKAEFFGDPEYGPGVEQNLYKFNNVLLLNILKDQIYTGICNYFPQLTITQNDITITIESKTTLVVSLYAFNNITQEGNLYNLDLVIDG